MRVNKKTIRFLLECTIMLSISVWNVNALSNQLLNNRKTEQKIESSNIHNVSLGLSKQVSRSAFLSLIAGGGNSLLLLSQERYNAANAFEGGVGGLGKTFPETGIVLFDENSTPIQNSKGIISAEIRANGKPVRVQFQAPWPLFKSSTGLEARGLGEPESAYLQVVAPAPNNFDINDRKALKQLALENILGQQGKYGAYALPTDIKFNFKDSADPSVFSVTFTAYTPSMYETDRKLLIKVKDVEGALILIVTGTTSLRFKSQENIFKRVIDSFEAIPAPKSNFR